MAIAENSEDILAHAIERAERKKVRQKEYYKKNKKKFSEYQKKYYREHIVYYTNYNKKYRPANKKKFREYMRARRNKEKFKNQFELPLSFAKEA